MKGKIGVTIIIIAFIVSIYPYMFLWMWIPYLVGALLVWISDMKVMAKAMWTVLPIAFWYPAIMLFYYALSRIG